MEGFLNQGFASMVRGGLRGVWVRGQMPHGAFVWAANHHSWWDPFLAAALLGKSRRAGCLLMEQENLARYAFTRRLGVFGSREPRRGLEYLRAGRVLVIFPEGHMSAGGPPRPLASGAAWFASRAGVPLCAVATRVVMRGQQAPEAYVSFTPLAPAKDVSPDSGVAPGDTERLTRQLSTELSIMDECIMTVDPRVPLPGFHLAVAGRRSWDERLDALSGSRSRRERTWGQRIWGR